MSLKIDREYNDFKVTFTGLHYSILVKEDQIPEVITHYFNTKDHNRKTCIVCKNLDRKLEGHSSAKTTKKYS
jgi:hypothetical protein